MEDQHGQPSAHPGGISGHGERNLPERDLLRRLFDAMPQLGWTAQPDGYIDYYNRGWYEFTGATPKDMEGWGWTRVHKPALLPAIVTQWKHSIETGEPFEATFQLRRNDGVFRWFLTRANPMRDDAGRIVRWVGINTDIDDQRQAERAAAAAESRREAEMRSGLENAVRMREDLLAAVSHDLRNPLNVIIMAATQVELLLTDPREPGVRSKKPVRTILKAAERMTRLVSDLLDVSKLEAGQHLPLDVENLDLVELTREAVELFEPVARARGITLTTGVDAPLYALCDGDRVQQVLSNLIGNAIKFTLAGGSICVRSRVVGGEVVVSVTDTGIGIPGHQLPHVFDRYWQHDSQPQRGAGLGLYIAKAIIDAHGGRIWVDSAPNIGSTFHFALRSSGNPPAPKEQK